MFAKYINEYQIDSSIPDSAIIDGKPYGNIKGKPELLAKLGFVPVLSSKLPEEGGPYRKKYEAFPDYIRQSWEEYVPEPEPVIVRQLSKIKIRKWLEARGLGEAFKTILASDPDALQDWNDAITLDDNDPKVEAICGMFVSQELLTLEDIATMKEECLSPYQE